MNNIYKPIILLSFFILGCNSPTINEKSIIQKINSLDMDIYSDEGSKIYSIKSPQSSYDKDSQTFNLEKTTINIFKDDESHYIINSNKSILTNNNKVLELNGNVELKNSLKETDIVFADNFIWNIDNSNYLLSGNVKYENKTIILTSNKAILNSENIIEFFYPVKYIIKNDINEKNYEINSDNAFYNIETNSVSFKSKKNRVRSKVYF